MSSNFKPAVWGAFTVAALSAVVGGITIAHAGGAGPDTVTTCHASTPCIGGNNKGTGSGVKGPATTTNGIVAMTSDSAPPTYSEGALFANATSASGPNGVYAFSLGRNGGLFENNNASYYALFAQSDAVNAYPFGVRTADGNTFNVGPEGDVTASGTMFAAGFVTQARTRDGQSVAAFQSQSAAAELSDVGTGRIIGGRGVVQLDSRFARTIDARSAYHVFLTPMGDTRGLYVAMKSASSFEVRESQGGRSTVDFDYRIIAQPAGASSARLPLLNMPHPALRGAPGRVPTR